MAERYDIGIAGCGIGGLTAGALLARSGHRVVIFDQFDEPAPVGSGLVIQPVGQVVLRAAGADLAFERGAKIERMIGRLAGNRRRVLDVSYGSQPGLAIHRASLFDALLEAARAAGCDIRTSCKVDAMPLQDGARYLALEDGRVEGPFDLVLDCTGAGSEMSPMKRRPLYYGALWGTVDWPEETNLDPNELSQCYESAAHMVGVLPLGEMPGDAKPKAAIFWSLPQDSYAAWRAAPLGVWKAEATALWPEFAPFIANLKSHDDLTMAGYTHGTLRAPVAERLVYIGDSAHCASPQLGQGANMAMLDAMALTLALDRLPINEALRTFARTRRWHMRSYQAMSRIFTPMYQSDSHFMPMLRDWVLAPAFQIPPVAWLATRLVRGDLIPPIAGVDFDTLG